MKICLISQEYPPETPWGGIGTQTWNKARALAERGHETHVLSRSAEEGADLRTELDHGVIVHRMKPPGYQFPIYNRATYLLGYSWFVLGKLAELMQQTDFDVLDFPEFGGEGFAYLLDRTTWNWVPVVVQLHGPLPMFIEYMGWPEKESRFAQVGTYLERFSVERADGLMACSASVAKLAERHYGVPAETIDVVHCGVDTAVFHPANRPTAIERPTILFVGAIVENKGAKVLVEAALRLLKKYPNLLLRMIGKGGPDLMEQIEAMIQAANARDNVEFLGFVALEKLPDYYRSAHLFCSPAAEFEGFGQVSLEAMACECPVIASTAGGGGEAVIDGETGLLVEPNDVAGTAAAMDRLLGDADLRRRLGRQARRRVEDYFAMPQFIRRVEAVYEKAIQRSHASPQRYVDARE
jgi:glycosyltransferase involved in cell wall biosynthesis